MRFDLFWSSSTNSVFCVTAKPAQVHTKQNWRYISTGWTRYRVLQKAWVLKNFLTFRSVLQYSNNRFKANKKKYEAFFFAR
jgi:hypothetical protein